MLKYNMLKAIAPVKFKSILQNLRKSKKPTFLHILNHGIMTVILKIDENTPLEN